MDCHGQITSKLLSKALYNIKYNSCAYSFEVHLQYVEIIKADKFLGSRKIS
jgi:hypothetical protein